MDIQLFPEKVHKASDSMDNRSEDTDVVRSVGSPSVIEESFEKNVSSVNDGDVEDRIADGNGEIGPKVELPIGENGEEDGDLPQCKIKRNYSCSLCPFFSQNPRSFLYHSRDVHFERIKIYECSQCLYASKHSQKLTRHINMIHVSGKTRKARSRIVKSVIRGPRPIRPKPSDISPEPLKEFSLLTEEQKLKIDTENSDEPEKTKDGEYKCSACSFKHKNPKFLRRHEKIVHLKKRYLRCSKCSYVTHVTARFTKHVKYHSMPMIKCDLCDFRTPYKWNLDRHYKNHSGSGAFQCVKCNFRADIKQSLTVHEMNHHTPPVGQGAAAARKKNKVGSSEAKESGSEMVEKEDNELPMEKGDAEVCSTEEVEPPPDQNTEEVTNLENVRNEKTSYNSKRESSNNNHLPTDFIHPDDVVPRYGQIYVKNLKCKFCSYKAVFSHEIWRHEKRIHGYVRPENTRDNVFKRPPPRLIPIQNKNSSIAILKIPLVRNVALIPSPDATSQQQLEKPVNEKEFNEMCKKSSLTSSLKDFVSLIGDEEGLKTIPDSSREELEVENSESWASEPLENSEVKNGDLSKQKQTDLLKKKNASFFDKLKEKLLTVNSEEQSLFCEACGHESKCLSEAVAHQKRHSKANYRSESDDHIENDIVLSGAELSSTRCQHCRQRCKTSTDLINHLKSCKAFEASLDSQLNCDDIDESNVKSEETSGGSDGEIKLEENNGTSMENRIFVWNDLGQMQSEEEEIDLNEYSLATSPGYGAITSKGTDSTESGTLVMEADPRLRVIVKRVFKCPHCPFWASTASRFHVHIVGHLNKKPFECSLCFYRSNWRWDITKHIRLKSLRDPSHSQAKVNMTDETGRRNYSKYNRFLTMMRVQEPTAESSGYGRRSRCGDITQGNATEKDILTLPAPPRLTRAPIPGVSHQVPEGVPLRPPPPLKAAHQIPSAFVKESKDSVKKTFWKCKKCNFRDTFKWRVLLHVKKHYIVKKNEKSVQPNTSSSSNENPAQEQDSNPEISEKSLLKTPSYSCGYCHQASHWKHVIQRHCKLKHNGDALIEVNLKDGTTTQLNDSEENLEEMEADYSIKGFSCDICPFTTDTEGDLTAHKLNHVDRPGSIFKCTYCPFYVPSKIAVLEHMEIHGIIDGCDLTSLKVDNFDPNEELLTQKQDGKREFTKKYKCLQCPYISHSRTQFLYHKQFHRPRNAPFKCLYCTYSVSRRHLLHQHLRVHHNQDAELQKQQKRRKKPEKPSKVKKVLEETDYQLIEKIEKGDILGFDIPEIPLFWVLKAGNIQKMYKCRWCPHVNVRKINIQEHEKMHSDSRTNGGSKLQCSDCNYTCSNAGVLASHVKVHQGFYGEIRSLVDPTRPEAEQIQELQNSLRVMEPEVLVVEGQASEIRDTEPLTSQPENAYSHSTEGMEEYRKILSFCDKCPARFFYKKELRIHSKFHMIHLPFRCSYCTYTARQRPHLLAHYKVHSQEYKERTQGLIELYDISPEHPQPKTAVITNQSYVMEGPVWGVEVPEVKKKIGKALPKYACHRCPATFFKTVALQYHLTLHGGNYKHKCKYCDYTVKTLGNLIKHQLVHEKNNKEMVKKSKFSYSFTISDKDLIQEEDEEEEGMTNGEEEKRADALSTLKKIKVKEKKYKCDKCPAAFEKRHQYEIHLSLHGSKQKYQCDQCDYSVKYYANFTQHLRKHENQEEVVKVKEETPPKEEDDKKTDELTLLEQQTLLLQERKKSTEGREEEKKSYDCGYCPYSSNKRDATENHSWRHFLVSGVKSGFECPHCDYSATQSNFLREHIKLHFNSASRYKAEAYLKCEKMELWCCEEDAEDPKQILIFQDRGEEEPERFFPPIVKYDFDQKENDWKMYLEDSLNENEESCDPCSSENEDLIEMIEEQVEEVEVEKVKPKRSRGKNWRCKKCPHAFGKKDQYLRHMSLHGSNQRHNCDICDYSVKFYTNYVQHMRMHQMHEPDRVIFVKKNFQSLLENSQKLLAASFVEEELDACFSLNESGFDNEDDESSQYNENLIIDESREEKEESLSVEQVAN